MTTVVPEKIWMGNLLLRGPAQLVSITLVLSAQVNRAMHETMSVGGASLGIQFNFFGYDCSCCFGLDQAQAAV